jgi:ERCC4-type nuclease
MLTACMIDNREPQHVQDLKFGGIPTVVTMLDTGDLWASCADGELLVIERKTPNDLLNSIKDGRLFNQCSAMRARSVWAYVVVTGALSHTVDGMVTVDGNVTGWRFDDVMGAILTVQELGVSVVFCRGDREYESTIQRLAKRERVKEKVIAPRSNGRLLTPGEQILSSLPGIGLERAQALMNEFDHVGRALAWLTWRHKNANHDVAGVGLGTKLNVRRALGLAEDEEIDVWKPEVIETMKQERIVA